MIECPHCGQRMLVRHGVRLPPLLADIFDLIEHSRERGVPLDTLAWVFYGGKGAKEARNCVKVNIVRLNDFLVQTDFRVTAEAKFAPYKVVKECEDGEIYKPTHWMPLPEPPQ